VIARRLSHAHCDTRGLSPSGALTAINVSPSLRETSFSTPALLLSALSSVISKAFTIPHQLRINDTQALIFTMSENLIPLAGEESKVPPPTYEAAAIQHGALPERNGPPTAGAKPLPRGPFPLDIPVLNQLRGKRIILASASPRRKQILSTVKSQPHMNSESNIFRLASQTSKSHPPRNLRTSQKT
jgi:hypothetical protein